MVKTGSHCFVPMSYIFVFWIHFFASETRFFVNLFNGSDLALCFIGPDFEFSMVSIQYFGTFHIIYVGFTSDTTRSTTIPYPNSHLQN